jgi:hypothetical protein
VAGFFILKYIWQYELLCITFEHVKPGEEKKVSLSIRIHPDIKAAAQKRANAESRTLSNIIELCLKSGFRKEIEQEWINRTVKGFEKYKKKP